MIKELFNNVITDRNTRKVISHKDDIQCAWFQKSQITNKSLTQQAQNFSSFHNRLLHTKQTQAET